jgi:hypothetical protein
MVSICSGHPREGAQASAEHIAITQDVARSNSSYDGMAMSSCAAPASRQLRPFQRFVRTEAAGGLLLFGCVCGALGIANSSWADNYDRLWATHLVVGLPEHGLTLTLHQWIKRRADGRFLSPRGPGDQAGAAGRPVVIAATGRPADRGRHRRHGHAGGPLLSRE